MNKEEYERKIKEYKNIIEKNAKEIDYLMKNSDLSDAARKERIEYLTGQSDICSKNINNITDVINKISDIEKNNDLSKSERNKKLKEFRKKINMDRIEYQKFSEQGKYRNLFSSLINNVDKKIHNFVYKDQCSETAKKIREKLYNYSLKRFNSRYENTFKYIVKNALITSAITIAPWVLAELVPALSGIMGIVMVVDGVFLGQTVLKSISAIYNNIRFDGASFERQYDIQKGSFMENIKSSWKRLTNNNSISYSVNKTNNVSSNTDTVIRNTNSDSNVSENLKSVLTSNIDSSKENVNDGKVSEKLKNILMRDKEESMTNGSDLPPVSIEEDRNNDKPFDNSTMPVHERVRRVDRLHNNVNASTITEQTVSSDMNQVTNNTERKRRTDKYRNSNYNNENNTNKMDFSTAVHVLRDKNGSYSDDEINTALTRVAKSFGSKNVTKEDIRKKLGDYNKLEQLLSYYGHKVKNNNATEEEKNTYNELLNQFARFNGDDYTINDFYADWAYEYAHQDGKSKGR